MKGLIILVLGFVIYFLPAIIVANRDHRHWLAIQILNLILGWTVLGWIVALVWSLMDQPTLKPSTSPTTTHEEDREPCPECAEMVLAAAKKCKHCGAVLTDG